MSLSDDMVVLPLPHYRLSGEDLYFMISTRPAQRLSPAEAALWRAIDGQATLAQLRQRHPAVADDAVSRFVAAGLCELAPERWPAARRQVLVIEPHSDDAALSVGATMWARREQDEFTLLTIASRSNFTSYWQLGRDYFGVDEVTALRNAEGALFMRCIGGRHQALDTDEATLRYQSGDWTLDWFKAHEHSIYLSNVHRADQGHEDLIVERLAGFLRGRRFDEIWVPMGVGPHSDHELARNACLRLLAEAEGTAGGARLLLYQDVPYDSQYPAHTVQIVDVLRHAGARLSEAPVEVTGAMDAKMRLLGVYASQFKLRVLRPGIERSAGQAPAREHFWQLQSLPAAVDRMALHMDATDVARLAAELGRGRERWVRAPVIRLILLLPAGRWEADMQALLACFPRARLEVFVSAKGWAETRRFVSDRVEVTAVAGGLQSWLRLLARLATRRPRPTLAVVGPHHLPRARRLARWWPLHATVVASTLDHLVMAARQALRASPGAHDSPGGQTADGQTAGSKP